MSSYFQKLLKISIIATGRPCFFYIFGSENWIIYMQRNKLPDRDFMAILNVLSTFVLLSQNHGLKLKTIWQCKNTTFNCSQQVFFKKHWNRCILNTSQQRKFVKSMNLRSFLQKLMPAFRFFLGNYDNEHSREPSMRLVLLCFRFVTAENGINIYI